MPSLMALTLLPEASGRVVQALRRDVAVLVEERDARVVAVDDVVQAELELVAIGAAVRVDAGVAGVRLELPDADLSGNMYRPTSENESPSNIGKTFGVREGGFE